MRKTSRLTTLLIVVGLLVALPALAETWTIALRSGGSFQTRYQPQQAGWDANRVAFLTDVGNLVSVAKSDVTSITSDTENRGFGKVLNTTTVMLGEAPNDAPEASQQQGGQGQPAGYPAEAEKPYSVQQFVEPNATQGIPGSLIPSYGGTGGSRQYQPTMPATPPPPPPATPPAQ